MDQRRHSSHPQPVELLPLPPVEVRKAVNDERRRYSRQMAEAVVAMNALHSAAYKDELTGLGNRRMLNEELPKMFAYADANDLPIALAYGDVRGLKRTNESEGHDQGDELLKATGVAFGEIVREGDIAIHLSGDEFVAVLLGYEPEEGQTLEDLNRRTTKRLSNRFQIEAHAQGIPEELRVGIDLAIVTKDKGDSPESLVSRAETLMRQVKESEYQDLENQGIVFEDNRL